MFLQSATGHTDLYFPPPPSCVHITIDPDRLVGVGIVSFRCKLEVGHEIVTAIDFLDTVDDIAGEKFICLASMLHLLSFKLWAVCRQFVNFLVQLVCVPI
jgi:hypothetical protein